MNPDSCFSRFVQKQLSVARPDSVSLLAVFFQFGKQFPCRHPALLPPPYTVLMLDDIDQHCCEYLKYLKNIFFSNIRRVPAPLPTPYTELHSAGAG